MSDNNLSLAGKTGEPVVVPYQSAVAPGEDAPAANWLGISTVTWTQIGVVTALLCAIFWPNLRRLWDKTNPFYGEANWGHAVCIPFISLYFLYVNRERLMATPVQPLLWPKFNHLPRMVFSVAMVTGGMLANFRQPGAAIAIAAAYAMWATWPLDWLPRIALISGGAIATVMPYFLLNTQLTSPTVRVAGAAIAVLGGMTLLLDWGLGVLFFGLLTYAYGIYPGQNDFVKDFGMVITLFGVVLVLCGWRVMKEAYFAIAFLICGIPWPGLFYSRVASPLQQLAAQVAVWTMELTGVHAAAGGTKILIYPNGYQGAVRTLNVAEACAGLRSLMTFISIGGAVAFLSGRPLWQKLLLTFAAIPIAIFCNVMRVSGQGLLDHYVSQQLSESFAHQFVGMIMFIPAFLLILLTGWVLDQIFVEEADIRHSHVTNKVLRRNTTVTAIPAASTILATGRPLALATANGTLAGSGSAVAPVVSAPVPGRSLAARRAQMQQAAQPKAVGNSPATPPARTAGEPEETV